MTWLVPWALFGVLAVALPILIHLLGRGRVRAQPFPTLRFIERSRLLPTRRTRLHDLLLLLVRVAIIASAALALAQPYRHTAARRDAFEQTLARVIILDTSESVRRVLGSDSARALAARLANEANVSVQLASIDIAAAIPGALAWLAQQSQRRELLIVSDFQTGAIDALTIQRIPAEVGLRLLRVGAGANASADGRGVGAPIETRAHFGTNVVAARVSTGSVSPDTATSRPPAAQGVEWTVEPDASHAQSRDGRAPPVRILAGASEQIRTTAAEFAANTVSEAAAVADSSHSIVIVTPGYEQRASLLTSARAPASAWVLDAIARLNADVTLRDAATTESPLGTPDTAEGMVVARAASGRAVVTAFDATIDGRATLMLVCDADAGSLMMATLVVAARNAIALHRMLGEAAPEQLADSVLRAWQRVPAAQLRPTAVAMNSANGSVAGASDATGDSSDARWLWVFALALLALETWLRRRGRAEAAEVARQ